MKRIEWQRLVRLGLAELGLLPDEFWGLTPIELMLMAGDSPAREALTRAGLEELVARFPDRPERAAREEE